jgi:nitrite reductase/ring-hydroxylating ferredoxin subunit
MAELTRRQFCIASGCALAVSGCGNGSNGGKDMHGGIPTDLAFNFTLPDFACAMTSVFAPYSSYAVGKATFYACEHMFICRDALGIYALTSICTHQQCDVNFQSLDMGGPDFLCYCHSSQYDFNGAVTMPPAVKPLVHFKCTLDANGNVVVDTSTVVAATDRLSVPGD